jgi:hypothetical protein
MKTLLFVINNAKSVHPQKIGLSSQSEGTLCVAVFGIARVVLRAWLLSQNVRSLLRLRLLSKKVNNGRVCFEKV